MKYTFVIESEKEVALHILAEAVEKTLSPYSASNPVILVLDEPLEDRASVEFNEFKLTFGRTE